MNVHVLCLFYRKKLYSQLLKFYKAANVIWHPICDHVDIQPFQSNTEQWIKPFLVSPILFEKEDTVFRKFNDFIDTEKIIDEDYYCFIGDDDIFQNNYFNVIRSQTRKILINSRYRGDTIPDDGSPPWRRHPVHPLILRNVQDIKVGNIGLGMFTIKGQILKQIKFINALQNIFDYNGNFMYKAATNDGLFAVDLKNKWPSDIVFLTDMFVFSSYFQPGRYSENAMKKFTVLKNFVS